MRPEITNKEAIEMMERCKNEVLGLRAQIESLAPKAHAYDNICAILRLLPQPSQGYGEDLVWIINKRIKELTPEPINAATAE